MKGEDGAVSLADTVSTVYGVVLDVTIPSAINPDTQTGSVARSGVFDATSLHVADGSNLADFKSTCHAMPAGRLARAILF